MKEYNPHKKAKVVPEFMTLQYDLILHETGKAMLVVFADKEVWLPKSQCEIIDETYSHIQITTWLAEKRGLEQFTID